MDEVLIDALERAFGYKFTEPCVDQLKTLCDQYLANCKYETARQTYHDVSKFLDPAREASNALWRFAYGGGERTDASFMFEHIMDSALEEHIMELRGRLSLGDTDSTEIVQISSTVDRWTEVPQANLPQGIFGVRLSMDLLRRVAREFRAAVASAEADINQRVEDELSDGRLTPHDTFLVLLRDWAKSNGYVSSPFKGGTTEPSKFAAFVAVLLNHVPEQWRNEGRDTAQRAVAEQIRRAVKTANRIRSSRAPIKEA